MRLPAPKTSAFVLNSTSKYKSARLYTVSVGAAVLAAIASLTGCGGGIPAITQPQTLTTPIASALGPQLGYIWVPADRTLRPILGVSGSSQVGQSLVPAGAYSGAVSSATASIAVLQDAGGGFDVMTLPSGSPVGLGITLPVGSSVRLSPSGKAALLYTPGASSASLVTGLSSTPQVRTVAAPGPIAESAVSDTGAISFEYPQGSSLAVGVMALDGSTAAIATVKSSGGLNFLPGHDDLLFGDGTASSLTLVRSATSAPSAVAIPTQLVKNPAALGVSGSGRWALVVNGARSAGAGQALVRVDLTTLAATQVTCACSATIAATLADDGAFRVTDAATGPNWIVDAARATPRTLFIPALPSSAPSSAKATLVASGRMP
jgi:hypothetical protein